MKKSQVSTEATSTGSTPTNESSQPQTPPSGKHSSSAWDVLAAEVSCPTPAHYGTPPTADEVERSIERCRHTRTDSDDEVLITEVASSSGSSQRSKPFREKVSSVDEDHDDVEIDSGDEALANAADRRARRVAYYNSIPLEFT